MATRFRPKGRALKHPFEPGPMMKPASELHGTLAGRPVVVMGNAYSLNYVDLSLLDPFKIIGCNRCMRPDSIIKRHPDYYVCVDRDPYAQEAERVREFKGIRVLSEMLFDPNNLHPKKRIRTCWAPLQPYPDFPWYGFRPVTSSFPRHNNSMVYTTWPQWDRTVKNGMIHAFSTDLSLLIPGAANVGYSMFQIAAALGASVIGIVGIDLSWESEAKSHCFAGGNGTSLGAFPLSQLGKRFFDTGYDACRRMGIEVYNLSPKGRLTPPVPRLSAQEFHNRFSPFAIGDRLYHREQRTSKPDKPRRNYRSRKPKHRTESYIENLLPKLATDSGRHGARRRTNQAQQRKAQSAALARARASRRKMDAGD